MKEKLNLYLGLALFCLYASTSVQAGSITYTWAGPASFEGQTQSFTGSSAAMLTKMIGNANYAKEMIFSVNSSLGENIQLDNLWTSGDKPSVTSEIQGINESLSNVLSNIDPNNASSVGSDVITPTNAATKSLSTEPISSDPIQPQLEIASIPEPGLITLLSIGLLGIGFFSNRHRFFSSAR